MWIWRIWEYWGEVRQLILVVIVKKKKRMVKMNELSVKKESAVKNETLKGRIGK